MEKFESFDLQKHIEKAREVAEVPQGPERHQKQLEVVQSFPRKERGIFELQTQKQKIMQALHSELKRIEKGIPDSGAHSSGKVYFDSENQQLVITQKKQKVPITFEWLLKRMQKNIYYHFDINVPRALRKRYAIEKAKRQIAQPYKEQQTLITKLRKHQQEQPVIKKQREVELLTLEYNPQYIEELKRRKQEVMERLKYQLRAIDRREDFAPSPEARLASYNPEGQLFEWQGKNQMYHLTLGDIVSDIRWGIDYYPGKEVPRTMRKLWAIENAKYRIAQLFDKQLLHERLSQELEPHIRKSYSAVQQLTEEQLKNTSGLIFERMIANLVRQLMVDKPGWHIKVEDTNVMEDVERKIDFIITFYEHTRGASIQERQTTEANRQTPKGRVVLGIQFTILSKEEGKWASKKLEYKMQSLEHLKGTGRLTSSKALDDVILISVPISKREVIRRYKQWNHLGKPPGGPEALFDIHTRIAFLKALMQGTKKEALFEEMEEELSEYYNSRIPEFSEPAEV